MLEDTYERLRKRLDGLTDDEFFWQPVADAWTIFEDRPGHWQYSYAVPDPNPAPVTTIGWQIVNVATCKLMYHEWAYGPAKLTWPELMIPHTASDGIALLDTGHRLLRADLLGLSEDDLNLPRRTNWGEIRPASRIFTVLIDHDALHGGAIGQMRDLYYWSHRRYPGPT
jgi:DinB superfamily